MFGNKFKYFLLNVIKYLFIKIIIIVIIREGKKNARGYSPSAFNRQVARLDNLHI